MNGTNDPDVFLWIMVENYGIFIFIDQNKCAFVRPPKSGSEKWKV